MITGLFYTFRYVLVDLYSAVRQPPSIASLTVRVLVGALLVIGLAYTSYMYENFQEIAADLRLSYDAALELQTLASNTGASLMAALFIFVLFVGRWRNYLLVAWAVITTTLVVTSAPPQPGGPFLRDFDVNLYEAYYPTRGEIVGRELADTKELRDAAGAVIGAYRSGIANALTHQTKTTRGHSE